MKITEKIVSILLIVFGFSIVVVEIFVPANEATEKSALEQEYSYIEQAGHNKTEMLTKGNIQADMNWGRHAKTPYGQIRIGDVGKLYTNNGKKVIEIPLKLRIDHQSKAGTMKLGFVRFNPYKGKWESYKKKGKTLRGKVAHSVNIVPGKDGVEAEIFEEKSNLPLSTLTKFENRKINAILKISIPSENRKYEKLGENTLLYRIDTNSPNFLRQLQIVFEPTYIVENGKTQGVQELKE